MVLSRGITYNLISLTVIACLIQCCFYPPACGTTKIVQKETTSTKERNLKPTHEKTKSIIPTESTIKLEENLYADDQKLLDQLESTTNIALILSTKMIEEDAFPLEKDDTSTSSLHETKLVESTEYTPVSSVNSLSTEATTTRADVKITTATKVENTTESDVKLPKRSTPCTCGIFLGSQIKKNAQDIPIGEAVITNTLSRTYSCDGVGQKHCQTKCLEQIVQHLPNSAKILCASLDRDIRKEKAYLFIKNCSNKWINTKLADGREYCCKNREPYKC